MSYSITLLLQPYKDKQGLHKVCFQVIHNRVKLYPATEVKIKQNQWNGQVVNHPHKDKLNHLIKKQQLLYEGLLLEAMKHQQSFTKNELGEILTGKAKRSGLRFDDFTYQLITELKGKFSAGTLKHYKVIAGKVNEFDDKTFISQINGAWLQRFENWLRLSGITDTTIKSNIKIVKAVVRSAENKGLINEVNFRGYKNLNPVTAEPEFLNEDELQKFFAVARAINKPGHKLAAYYFLLSCFAGFRIGDAKRFNYKTMVQNDEIVVRTRKNGKVVTIPLYSDLIEVLNYINDKPLYLSEQKTRQYIKEIASLAGIKKHVKYHTSRHTATSRLIEKGFNAHEVAEIIGDSQAVINKVYAHVDKQSLKKKVKALLG